MIKKTNTDKNLEKLFLCYGHYYKLRFREKEYMCRSVLEIITKDNVPVDPNKLLKTPPDAIFILKSPQSWNHAKHTEQIIDSNQMAKLDIKLSPTVSDSLAIQIMKVMLKKEWTHVRVLSLTDICSNIKMGLCQHLEELEQDKNGKAHSIFSKRRAKELKKKLNIDNPIYAAWGIEELPGNTIQNCLRSLSQNTKVKGLLKSGTFDKYYLPSVNPKPYTKKEWVKYISLIE